MDLSASKFRKLVKDSCAKGKQNKRELRYQKRIRTKEKKKKSRLRGDLSLL